MEMIYGNTFANIAIELEDGKFYPLAYLMKKLHEIKPILRGDAEMVPLKHLMLCNSLHRVIEEHNAFNPSQQITHSGDFYDYGFRLSTLKDDGHGVGKKRLEELSHKLQSYGLPTPVSMKAYFTGHITPDEESDYTLIQRYDIQNYHVVIRAGSKSHMTLSEIVQLVDIDNNLKPDTAKVQLVNMNLPTQVLRKLDENRKFFSRKVRTALTVQDVFRALNRSDWQTFCKNVALGPKEAIALARQLQLAGMDAIQGMPSFKTVDVKHKRKTQAKVS